VAKFRAARRLWARIMRERFGATNPRALALRFHAQTGGSTLTAQQPENNVVRVAIQALSAVAGGAQSLHTNGYDEALALPTEHAAFGYRQQVEAGERVSVGVNAFEEQSAERIELLRIDPAAERRQLERTARLRAERNAEKAATAIAAVREAARGETNMLPPMREALRARCTVGEICE